MSETRLDAPGEVARGGLSRAPVSQVHDLFVTLGKALRAYQLYEENNPVYQRFVASLRDAFKRIWNQEDELKVTVEEWRLLMDGVEVYASESRSESLAFLFFRDGVRQLTFLPGIEEHELEPFLDVLHQARHMGTRGDDLLNVLWEASLQNLRYHYVDMLAEGVEIPEPGAGASAERLQAVLEEEVREGGEKQDSEARAEEQKPSGTAAIVNQEGFNPTLYSLDPREMGMLQREIDLEMGRDLRGDVLAALFDRLEEPKRVDRQSEILSILKSLLPNLLGRGALEAAAQVLQELRTLEAQGALFDEQRRREVSELLDQVSSTQTIEELVRALEDGSISPAPRQLSDFLTHLRAGALAPLLRASETVMSRELQPVLQEAVKGIAGRNRERVVELLSHGDSLVVSGATRLVGRLQVSEATGKLGELLRHEVPAVRLSAIEAAMMLRASTAAGALQEALTDSQREVRIAAARALGRLRYRPAAQRFRTAIASRELRAADLTEKIAFFESYGELGDEKAVGILDKLLNGRGLLGRKESAEIRACSALALGKVGTPQARNALEQATTEEDPVVRSAVNRALRGSAEGEA